MCVCVCVCSWAREQSLLTLPLCSRSSQISCQYSWASMVAQMVTNPPAVQETCIRSLGWEDPLEEDMASHSSILAWSISMDRGAWWATVHGITESDTVEQLNTAGWPPMCLLWVFCHCLAVFLSQNCLGVRWANAGYMLPTRRGM